ncbi:MAG TPA: hypothetical protein VIC05_06360 [Solirubrobacteraceae bacterium]|jgi:hypothetical protein
MSFEVNRLRRSDWIVGGGAVALLVVMFFFKWYGASVKGAVPLGGSVSYGSSTTGWDTFTNSRWIWLITILAALFVVALAGMQRKLNTPIQLSVVVTLLGALSTLLILYRIIHHPHGSTGFAGVEASYGIKIGIWLGLIAAGVLTYGGYAKMTEDGTSLSDVRDQASRAVSGLTDAHSSPVPTGAQSPVPPPVTSDTPAALGSTEPPMPPSEESFGDSREEEPDPPYTGV